MEAGFSGHEVRVGGCGGEFEAAGAIFADEGAEGWDGFEEVGDFFEGPEAAQAFEGGDGNCHFGFVVVIWVVFGVLGVQFLS